MDADEEWNCDLFACRIRMVVDMKFEIFLEI